MNKPRRIRRILKWVGAGMCILTFAALVTNRYRVLWFHLPSGTICLADDGLCLSGPDAFNDFWRREFGVFRTNAPGGDAAKYRRWLPKWNGSQYMSGELMLSWRLYLPLWLAFTLLATATGLIWLFDRRFMPTGHCRNCGYNLTGNVSGVCPECGTSVQNAEPKTQN